MNVSRSVSSSINGFPADIFPQFLNEPWLAIVALGRHQLALAMVCGKHDVEDLEHAFILEHAAVAARFPRQQLILDYTAALGAWAGWD
ncbi:hypothetical protein AAKU55_005476 [Oxalobacteraceae bacterium GrIS 1.11]